MNELIEKQAKLIDDYAALVKSDTKLIEELREQIKGYKEVITLKNRIIEIHQNAYDEIQGRMQNYLNATKGC